MDRIISVDDNLQKIKKFNINHTVLVTGDDYTLHRFYTTINKCVIDKTCIKILYELHDTEQCQGYDYVIFSYTWQILQACKIEEYLQILKDIAKFSQIIIWLYIPDIDPIPYLQDILNIDQVLKIIIIKNNSNMEADIQALYYSFYET